LLASATLLLLCELLSSDNLLRLHVAGPIALSLLRCGPQSVRTARAYNATKQLKVMKVLYCRSDRRDDDF
jgi:hypothetical protein